MFEKNSGFRDHFFDALNQFFKPARSRLLVYTQPELKVNDDESALALLSLMHLRNDLERNENFLGKHEQGFNTNVKILFNGKLMPVGRSLGYGHSKSIYDIGDGNTIAVPNSSSQYRSMDIKKTRQWHYTVLEEVSLAAHLRKIGLKALDYQMVTIKYCDLDASVLSAPSFSELEKNGLQIIDRKSGRSSSGGSLLFGSVENLKNEKYLFELFKDIIKDTAILIANNLSFKTSDSYNLAIENTKESPVYDVNAQELYADRKQKIRLYFYDLSGAYDSVKSLRQNNGIESRYTDDDEMMLNADFCLDQACHALCAGITSHESTLFKSSGVDDSKTIIIENYNKIKADLITSVLLNAREYLSQFKLSEDIKMTGIKLNS